MELRSAKREIHIRPCKIAKLKDIMDNTSIDDNVAQKREADMMTFDNLRHTIYRTIMNGGDSFKETAHELHKMVKLKHSQKIKVCKMLIECCSKEQTYKSYYSLVAQMLCMMSTGYKKRFDDCFREQSAMIHQCETTKLLNVAKFFVHLLGKDVLPWHTLSNLWLMENSTSSPWIFIKVLFQELAEDLGLLELKARLAEPLIQDSLAGILPKDNPKNTQFAIKFFTAIGLGGLTSSLHEYLNSMPSITRNQRQPQATRKRLASQRECCEGSDTAAKTVCSIEDCTVVTARSETRSQLNKLCET